MATVVIMPRQGQSVESCVITEFKKKVGDNVEKGDVLFSYETDKSSFDEPAPVSGKILAIFKEEGEDVPCLENVLVIGAEGEDYSQFVGGEVKSEAPKAEEKVVAEAPAQEEAKIEIDPSKTVVIMPRQGQSVESCVITAFNKKLGDKVEKGEVLFSYETDKSSFDEPSPVSGKIIAVFREEGDDVPCLENVLVIGDENDAIMEVKVAPVAQKVEAPKAEVKVAVAEPKQAVEVAPVKTGDVTSISPRARLLAEKTNADLLKAVPTGPNGRIIERDVQKLVDMGLTVSSAAKSGYAQAVEGSGINGKVVLSDLNKPVAQEVAPQAPVNEFDDVKLPNIRKVIAKSMHASLSTMAQLTLNSSFDATKIMALRASLKKGGEALGLGNITINDMVLFAVSKVLLKHKDLNAHFLDDKMRYFNVVNLGVATDTDRGLVVPTVFRADSMSLTEISKAAKAVINEAKSGKINPDLLKGASFTVTNLGSLGVESFTPVINPPQTAILGVCNVTRRAKQVNGVDVFYDAMGLSLTFDHRALDGAPAARFLKDLCFYLENFDLLLVK